MTPERMNWNDDERLYQPRMHSRWIRHLHRISIETGEPMTVLLDHALTHFVEQYVGGHDTESSRETEQIEQPTQVRKPTPIEAKGRPEDPQDL